MASEFIVTRHLGARPHRKNPLLSEGDPDSEFFFVVRKIDQGVTGPLTRAQWDRDHQGQFGAIKWERPRNPNFWLPLLGSLFAMGFMAVYLGWPLLILSALGLGIWLWKSWAPRIAD